MRFASAWPVAAKIAAVAVLYVVSGQIGLALAVPPGYATIIWPASGIAVGALVTHGRALWPGVFLGSLALNAAVGGAYAPGLGVQFDKLAIAAAIAAGSTAQALVADWLIGRFLGSPVRLTGLKDILTLFAIAAPASCLIAATCGVATLYLGGAITADQIGRNWLTWWSGDVLGILIVLPPLLVAPGAPRRLSWRGDLVGVLPLAAFVALVLPLGLTFYAWKASSYFLFDRNSAIFDSIAQENERALLDRIASYERGLRGAIGFLEGSSAVTADDWRAYVSTLRVSDNYRGINGIGLIRKVAPENLASYAARAAAEQPGFRIHPETPGRPNFIIEYISPVGPNASAIGLNIAFEANRLEAATLAEDTGLPAITKRITLVQDTTRSNGFLLLLPYYKSGAPIRTVAERRDALIGWVYAPFVASNFMQNLGANQGSNVALSVFDGAEETPDALIYGDDDGRSAGDAAPTFVKRITIEVMQQRWTLAWRSTPAFEARLDGKEPIFVLVGGLVFTALFGALLFLFAQRAETVRQLVEVKTRELSEREALYRLLAENTNDMISRVALDGTRIYVSPASRQLLGYEPEELQLTDGKNDVQPDQRVLVDEIYRQLAAGEIDEWAGVFKLRRKDGVWIDAEVVWRLIREPDTGTPIELVVTKRDVTQRERRAEEIRIAKNEAEVAKAKAEQANEAKTAFLATMSHEIRTPLNGVIGYTDMMLASSSLSEDNRRHANRIASAGAALLTVVNDILDFSKIEAGQIELDVHPFALEALVDNALSIVKANAVAKGLTIEAHIDPEAPRRLLGDENRLRQVLLNLLNNAVKFTAKGGVTLTIERLPERGSRCALRVAVRDTGIGIPRDQRGRLFKQFSQVDGSSRRNFGGSGLGLAISKRLVELMGGRIGVASAKGLGSTFWFEVALEPTSLAPLAPWEETAETSCAPVRVLLVEDAEINQEIAAAVLRNAGHEVDIVADGADAVTAVGQNDYDLVFMDVQMPGMDGVTATRLIRGLASAARDVPIVALTANVLPFQRAELREAGMTDHVGKPFRPQELLGAVARHARRGDRAEAPADPAVPEEATPAPEAPPFNEATFADLVSALGAEGAARLMSRLADALGQRMGSDWSQPDGRDALRRDAHMLASSTGMSGFDDLSALCREIEAACAAGDELSALMARYAALKARAVATISGIVERKAS